MDTRRFLLAEHYDSLGLFKMADSLDKYDLVNKPKKVNVQNQPTTNNEKQQESITQRTLKKVSPILKPALEYGMPLVSGYFTINEINNLTKEVLNLHSVQKLTEIAKAGKISPQQSAYIKTLILNQKINPEIKEILKKVSQNSIPTVNEVEALVAGMPSIASQAKSSLVELKALASKYPSQFEKIKVVVGELSKKIKPLSTIAKGIPVALIFLQLYLYKDDIRRYFDIIASGRINEIFNDAEDRAHFVVLLADLVSSFTILFPPLAALSSALMAISFGTTVGLHGIDKYREMSGEKEKQDLDMKFNYRTDIKNEYAPTEDLISNYTKNKNIKEFVKNYINDVMKNNDAKYAMKVFVVPKLYEYIRLALGNSEPELKLKIVDLMNLSVLNSDITENRKNKQVVTKSLPDFIKNPTDPKNKMAFYEFRDAIKNLVPVINKMYVDFVDFINSVGPKK